MRGDEWVPPHVAAMARTVIRWCQEASVAMHDVYKIIHDLHLQPSDGGIIPVISKEKHQGILISNPRIPEPPKVVRGLRQSPVSCKTFSEVRVQSRLESFAASAAKAHEL